MASNSISVKEGWLSKKGANTFSSFRSRYVILWSDKRIEYYADDSLHVLKGTIKLNDLHRRFIQRSDKVPKKNKSMHGFKIITKKRTWFLCANNAKLRDEWIQTIRNTIDEKLSLQQPKKSSTALLNSTATKTLSATAPISTTISTTALSTKSLLASKINKIQLNNSYKWNQLIAEQRIKAMNASMKQRQIDLEQTYQYIVAGYIKRLAVGQIPMDIISLITVFWSNATFEYHHDFDKNGLLYYIGSDSHSKTWQNPQSMDAIETECSGLDTESSVALHHVVGRDTVRCVTTSTPNSWIIIRFVHHAINPTHYTLRHYSAFNDALRNWRLEGSLDGNQWIVLKEHHNDESLSMPCDTKTWQLQDADAYFSMFRVIQFDLNSNGQWKLALSGFEIYGNAVRKHTSFRWHITDNNDGGIHIENGSNCIVKLRSSVLIKQDKLQMIKTSVFDFGMKDVYSFSVLVEQSDVDGNDEYDDIYIGMAPNTEQWNDGDAECLGECGSWGYLGNSGQIMYDTDRMHEIRKKTKKWAAGDVVTVIANSTDGTMEFMVNGVSQCVLDNFDLSEIGSNELFGVVSVSNKNTRIRLRLCQRVAPLVFDLHEPTDDN